MPCLRLQPPEGLTRNLSRISQSRVCISLLSLQEQLRWDHLCAMCDTAARHLYFVQMEST